MPGAPGKVNGAWDLDAVLEFVASHAAKESTSAKVSSDVATLKAREIELRCERMRFHLDLDRGKYLELSQVEQQVRELIAGQLRILRQKLEGEWPSAVAGMDPAPGKSLRQAISSDLLMS
jgi:hypothetical protein